MRKYVDFVEGTDSRAVVGASVRVLTYPGNVLASLFADDVGTPKSNPVTTDSTGEFSFYIADGRYTLEITGSGILPQIITDIVVFGAEDLVDASANAASAAASAASAAASAASAAASASSASASQVSATASASSATTSAAAAAASLAAAQAIASGALVSEQHFTGPGPWLMTGPVVGVTGFRVNGIRWRLTNLQITGSPPLVVNISARVISNDSEIDIEHT